MHASGLRRNPPSLSNSLSNPSTQCAIKRSPFTCWSQLSSTEIWVSVWIVAKPEIELFSTSVRLRSGRTGSAFPSSGPTQTAFPCRTSDSNLGRAVRHLQCWQWSRPRRKAFPIATPRPPLRLDAKGCSRPIGVLSGLAVARPTPK